MKKLMIIGACAALACGTGCLSVARFAKLGNVERYEPRQEWSEEAGSNVTVVVHHLGGGDPFAHYGLFPSVGMRWDCLKMAFDWIPPRHTWAERRIGLFCTTLALTPGLIVDLPVDLLSIPWDWKYRGGGETMYDREQKERALRSKCEFCGAVSEEGRFGLCIMGPRLCEERKERLGTRHGCCPACAAKAKEAGYRFR